jgi:nucleoid DNA-binding protein
LNPKNHKEFIKPTADKLGCSEILVEDAVEFFYGSLQKMMGSLEHQQIEVLNLGTFKVRPKEVDNLIQTQELFLKKMGTPQTMNKMGVKRNVEVTLEKAKALEQKIEAERTRKKEFMKKKYGGKDQ